MTTLLKLVVALSLAAVTIVLLMGLWNMMKGGSQSRSQSLMRMRVLLQGIAIAAVMTTLWFMERGS